MNKSLEAKLRKAEEINHGAYDTLAKYWDDYVKFPERQASYYFYESIFRSPNDFASLKPAILLDVGGGAGHHAIWLARCGHKVKMCDSSDEMVAQALARAASAGVSLDAKVASWDSLINAYRGSQFDGVLQSTSSVALNLDWGSLVTNFMSVNGALKPFGRYAFDIRNFEAYELSKKDVVPIFENDAFKVGATLLYRPPSGPHLHQNADLIAFVTYHKPTKTEVYQIVRAWSVPVLVETLESTGFRKEEIYYDYHEQAHLARENIPPEVKNIQIVATK